MPFPARTRRLPPRAAGALVAALSIGCGPPTGPLDGAGGNVLLVILDDVGVDKIAAYGLHPNPPPTPRIDALAEQGVRFEAAFAYPSCSPTRAALLTGRHGRRTGIGRTVDARADEFVLSPDEVGMPELLRRSDLPYASAAVGKWHLSSETVADGYLHPALLGFDRFTVTMGNPGGGGGYVAWDEVVDGEPRARTGYLTSAQVDDALTYTEELPEPWLVWLAFNAPHTPLHVPPAHLHSATLADDASPQDKYDAMLEAVDTELGRLLDDMDPEVLARTTVIVVGDNGTPGHATTPPFDRERAKTTLFEGGTHVPLVVAGPHVLHPGTTVGALVHVVDVLPTVAALAGVPLHALYRPGGALARRRLDGESLLPFLEDPDLPGRAEVFLEKFAPNGDDDHRSRDTVALRDRRWRYLRPQDGGEQLFDLSASGGLVDGPDVLAASPDAEAREAHTRLALRLDAVLAAFEATGAP